MKELELDAKIDMLDEMRGFLDKQIEGIDCSTQTAMQLEIATEEIFTNICSYAYENGGGKARIQIGIDDKEHTIAITFTDSGVPYNPLENEDPDINLAIEDRPIGGLGIFMVKKMMDSISYEYKNGENILMLKKKF